MPPSASRHRDEKLPNRPVFAHKQVTIGQKTVVMAGAELSSTGDNRRETGNSFFAILNSKEMRTFEEVIRKFVRAGVFGKSLQMFGLINSAPFYPTELCDGLELALRQDRHHPLDGLELASRQDRHHHLD